MAAHRHAVALLPLLLPIEELHLEGQPGIRWDLGRRAALAVSIVGAAEEDALFAAVHCADALVPALDDATDAHIELEEAGAVAAAVKLGAIGEGSDVVHGDIVSWLRRARVGIAGGEDLLEEPAVAAQVHSIEGFDVRCWQSCLQVIVAMAVAMAVAAVPMVVAAAVVVLVVAVLEVPTVLVVHVAVIVMGMLMLVLRHYPRSRVTSSAACCASRRPVGYATEFRNQA